LEDEAGASDIGIVETEVASHEAGETAGEVKTES
jgi:hypothetical protein